MVLAFALCATFGFAQTKNTARAIKAQDQRAVAVKPSVQFEQKAGFNGSIFTKDGELYTNDFSDVTSITRGVITAANQLIGGTNAPIHAQTEYHSTWQRWEDTTMAYCMQMQQTGHYPYLIQQRQDGSWFNRAGYFYSSTPNNGFMLMSMIDQVSTGATGAFDAFMAFPAISTVGSPLVDVRFYQYYMKFNADQCFIDYSTDGTTWNAFEINVRNVDLGSNDAIRGFKRVTLPAACGNQANLYLRLRWTSSSNNGGVYGYYWYVDDLTVSAAPASRLTMKSNEHFEGFYHQLPQGLNLPLTYRASFVNDGLNAQNNVTALVRGWMEGSNDTLTYVSQNAGTIASNPEGSSAIVIDPMGWYDANSEHNGLGFTGTPDPSHVGYLPTANVGVGHFFTDITTSTLTHVWDSLTLDTLRFEVNFDASYHNGKGTWARDNSLVSRNSYFTPGAIREGQNGGYIWSDSYEDTHWDEAGYGAFVSYVTGSQVPQGWKVLGVEMVAATQDGLTSPGAQLIPYLFRDSIDAETGNLNFYYMNTGASTYTVTANDLISSSDDYEYLTYMTPGDNYPTVFIPFPEQPDLLPSSSYRIGYRLAQEGNFAVASSTNGYYDPDGAWHYYYNEPGMASYGNVLTVDNFYSTLTWCPFEQGYAIFPVDEYPMIRMIVGPSFYVPHFAVTFECDDEELGYFANGRNESLCGLTDSVAQGGSVGAYIYPSEGYEIDKIWIDGVETTDYEWDAAEGYGYVELENVQAAHTFRCSFKLHVGIDAATGVSMKLQPNPATSNVNVSMKGVSGNVNMSLIDMSGRVITTSTFNAENGTNINVSNLAKGAYFVRISNDKFSKVEKLIVR